MKEIILSEKQFHKHGSFYLGTAVHDRLVKELTKKTLVAGIRKASPLAQTSCLEGFHSVLNYFCPKMLAYSYAGMYCRYVYYVFIK